MHFTGWRPIIILSLGLMAPDAFARGGLRPFSTDRPTQTPDPHTIDVGHLMTEINLFTYSRNLDPSVAITDETMTGLTPTFRLGVSDITEVQVTFPLYTYRSTEGNGARIRLSNGFGDTTSRVKFNLFGNDGSPWAQAVMPIVKVPTGQNGNSNGYIEGGLAFPGSVILSLDGSSDWMLGYMAEWDMKRSTLGLPSYYNEVVGTFYLTRAITKQLTGFFDLLGRKSLESGTSMPLTAFWDAGLYYLFTQDIQLDIAAAIGLSDAADDFSLVTGFAFRL